MMQQGHGHGYGHSYGYAPSPPPSMRQEIPLLAEQGIQVTSARFVVYQQTYPINGITHVAPFSFQPSRNGALISIVFCAFGTLGGLASASKGEGVGMLLLFALLTGLGIWWFVSRKMQHGVIVSTAGQQHRALVTTDGALVGRIVGALNHAIAMR